MKLALLLLTAAFLGMAGTIVCLELLMRTVGSDIRDGEPDGV